MDEGRWEDVALVWPSYRGGPPFALRESHGGAEKAPFPILVPSTCALVPSPSTLWVTLMNKPNAWLPWQSQPSDHV